MTSPQDLSSDDPGKKSDSPVKASKDYEKVVDELRNVLSGLNKTAPQELPPEVNQEDELLRPAQPLIAPDDVESEKLGEAAFRQASSPSSSETPSDSEFWNGNVLGWPDSFSEGMNDKEEPVPPAPIQPPPERDIEIEPFSSFSEQPDLIAKNSDITSSTMSPSETDEVPPQEDDRTAFLGNLRIPVPGTLHQVSEPSKTKKQEAPQIQIGVFYPNGNESIAAEFVTNLKTAATKTAGCPAVGTVLSTPWFLTQVNFNNWKKAAALSGANFLFVLAYKKDKDLFKDLSKVGHQDEVRARVVFIELIKLKTLYADLLSEMIRSFNVQG